MCTGISLWSSSEQSCEQNENEPGRRAGHGPVRSADVQTTMALPYAAYFDHITATIPSAAGTT
eukprot:scaffold903_cov123-Skeletonema_dohrnii-CCMP3373.AAC.4